MSKDIEVFEQKLTIKNIYRANQKKQKPKVLWFTGISGSGKVENFTGKTSSYEIPVNPDLNIKTHSQSVKEAAEEILNFFKKKLI